MISASALAAVNGVGPGGAVDLGAINGSTTNPVVTGNTPSSGNAATTGPVSPGAVVQTPTPGTGTYALPGTNVNGSNPDSAAARGINSADSTGLSTHTLGPNGEVIRTQQAAPVVVPALPANR